MKAHRSHGRRGVYANETQGTRRPGAEVMSPADSLWQLMHSGKVQQHPNCSTWPVCFFFFAPQLQHLAGLIHRKHRSAASAAAGNQERQLAISAAR